MFSTPATRDVIQRFLDVVVNPFVYILMGLAILVFLWGVFQWIYHADDSKERQAGKNNILYGILGLFIMVAVYGILNVITGTFGIPDPYP